VCRFFLLVRQLISASSQGYTSADKPFRRGEILSKSMANTPGYYKDEEKTRETLTEDGWLRTGDIGLLDEFGRIKIIDRISGIIKLSQGQSPLSDVNIPF